MAETPIIDAAVKAYFATDGIKARDYVIAVLRAALPWEPPAETIEAMRLCSPMLQMRDDAALAAYRAQPIMRELYPERF